MYNPKPKFTKLASDSMTINSPSTAFGRALIFSGLSEGRTFGLEFHDAASGLNEDGVMDIALTFYGKPGSDDAEDVIVLRVKNDRVDILKRVPSGVYQPCGQCPFPT